MCSDSPVITLTAHDKGGTWTGPGVTGDKFNPSAAGAGNHIITYSIINGTCSDADQITIIVSPKPDATIIVPVKTLCINDAIITLMAHEPGGTWTGTGVTGNQFNPVLAGIGVHMIKYSITGLNGCSDDDQITITVVPVPDASITRVDTLCIDNPAIVLETKEPGGIWSGAVTSAIFNPSSVGTGDHIIKYSIIENNGCRDSDQITITVVPVPVAQITHTGNFKINAASVALTATPPGGIFSGDGMTGNIFNPSSAGLGTHVIKYQTKPDRYGCLGIDTVHIKVFMPPLPTAAFEPDTSGCAPMKVQFINKSANAESYLWDFGDKVYSTDKDPVHTYYSPGSYIVSLAATNVTGQSVHKLVIIVYQNPTAIFNAYPTEVTNNAQIVVFSNISMYDDSWLWKFGDGSISTEENPWHKYLSEGTYDVTLIVKSIEGCIDSANFITPVHVKFNIGKIKFPNAFAWNREGPTGGYWHEGNINDFLFRPHFENVLEYKLQIFNRWGVLIYESTDLYKGWDGYFGNGNLALEGVYVWHATGRFVDGKYFNEIGDVTFLH
jgi:PKD repeat protein